MYDGAAQLSFHLEFAGPVAAIVWLPVGVGIAFVYFSGLPFLPGVLIGDLLANDYGALPLGSAIGQTCGNVLEVAVAILLIRRLARRGPPLATVDGLGGMLIAIASGVAVSATMGTLSLRLGGVISTDAMPTIWRTWWLGDACGALVVVPLALAWWTTSSQAQGDPPAARVRSASGDRPPPRPSLRCEATSRWRTWCSRRSSGQPCGSASAARR